MFPFGACDGQTERFFLVETASFKPRPTLTAEESAQEHVTDVRWWTVSGMLHADAVFAPRRLPQLFQSLIEHGPPPQPIDAGL